MWKGYGASSGSTACSLCVSMSVSVPVPVPVSVPVSVSISVPACKHNYRMKMTSAHDLDERADHADLNGKPTVSIYSNHSIHSDSK